MILLIKVSVPGRASYYLYPPQPHTHTLPFPSTPIGWFQVTITGSSLTLFYIKTALRHAVAKELWNVSTVYPVGLPGKIGDIIFLQSVSFHC